MRRGGFRVRVAVDRDCQPATNATEPEQDATVMFLERVDKQCGRGGSHGFVIEDRPGGGRTDENSFLRDCLETIHKGTEYVEFSSIAHNVLSTQSRFSRLLQAADLVTSCTLSLVAGEDKYAPAIFEHIKPLLDREKDRIGGFGLKLHPDFRYANLYQWLVEDTHFWRANSGVPFPLKARSYATGPATP